MKRAERNQLIDDLIDSAISEADFLRLEAEMHIDPAARAAYYDRLKLDTALGEEFGEASSGSSRRGRSVGARAWQKVALAALLILASGLGGWLLGKREGEQPVATAKATPAEVVVNGFGVVADLSGEMLVGGTTVTRGELVPQSVISLSTGLAQIELFSGVTLSIEGPAAFEMLSSSEMRLIRGKLQAEVPPLARGFRVKTLAGDVVDLGTKFSLSVSENYADVRVLDGEVEWYPISNPMMVLENGEAVRSTAGGEVVVLSGAEAAQDFEERIESHRVTREEAWRASVEARKEDDRLLLFYPMVETDAGRALVDASAARRDGSIVRADRVADRWGKAGRAMDFSPTGSRVRVDVPGEHRSITLSCWVRIDSLDRWYNSLFLTDGHELNEPHWQIMNDGRLFFSVKRRDAKNDKHIAYSPPVWTPALSGKWMHIATVYDGDAKTTTHYVNGEQVSRDAIPESMQIEKVQIGAASIGNWSEPKRDDPNFAVRNLNGAMDEFALYAAALSEEEIQELYETGNP